MIRHNATAVVKNFGGEDSKSDNHYQKERKTTPEDQFEVFNAREEFGLPVDAKRVRFVVAHGRAKGTMRWFDGEMPGEASPGWAGNSHGRDFVGLSTIDALLNEAGAMRFRVVGNGVKLQGLTCLAYWR